MAKFKIQTKVKLGVVFKIKIILYRIVWPTIKLFSDDVESARSSLCRSLSKSVSFEHSLIKSEN